MRACVPAVACLLAWTLAAPSAHAADEDAERAAESLATFRRHCEPDSFDAFDPDRCEGLAFDAVQGYRRAHDSAKAIATGRVLVAYDASRGLRSAIAAKASLAVAQTHRETALFEHAADWFGRTANEYPKAPEAEEALRDAISLRLALGRMDEAVEGARTYSALYGRSSPEAAAVVSLAIGWSYAEHEAWPEARAWLDRTMPGIDRGTIDTRATAHALLGRASSRTGDKARAKDEYAVVLALESDPSKIEAELRHGRPDEDEGRRTWRLARVLLARGEALFAEAEAERAALGPAKLPAYVGPRDAKALRSYVETRVVPWAARRAEAIEKLESAYAKVLGVAPFPPPTWSVAASASVAASWTELVDALRRIPRPKDGDPLATKGFYSAFDSVLEPVKVRHAKPACLRALDLAAKLQVADDGARACAAWLAKSYTAEHFTVEEIVPRLRADRRVDAPLLPW